MIRRQLNVLGQMRIDVPHLRSLASAVAFDFDTLAGDIMVGSAPQIVRGFAINMTNAVSNPAINLSLVVAGSAMMHPLASEAGTIFSVEDDASVEVLSATNPRVIGAFTSNALNYVGLDLRRTADASTTDLVQILDADTKLETPKAIPLGRILDFRIIISTQDFSATPTICPIAKVQVAGDGTVSSVEDSRPMMWRLGTGGTSPNRAYVYPWSGGRAEGTTGTTLFTGGDKVIGSLKEHLNALMTRLWELGGGEYWYSGTSDRGVKLCFGQPVLGNGDNFSWNSGTATFQWTSLSLLFTNSTATFNDINNGSIVLGDGQCAYVDCDRTTNRTAGTALNIAVANRATLGQPTVPGSRIIIAWRRGTELFIRDKQYEAGRLYAPVASTSTTGTVKLSYAAGAPSDPVVAPLGANANIANTATGGNANAFTGVGNGSGAGFFGTGGATGGTGVVGVGGAANGNGVAGSSSTGGHGVQGVSTGTGHGGRFVGHTGSSTSSAIRAEGGPGLAGDFTTGTTGRGIRVQSNFGVGTATLTNAGNVLSLEAQDTANQEMLFSMLHADATSPRDGWVIKTTKIADDNVDWALCKVVNGLVTERLTYDMSTDELIPNSTGTTPALGSTAAYYRSVFTTGLNVQDDSTSTAIAGTLVAYAVGTQTVHNLNGNAASRSVSTLTGGNDGQIVIIIVTGANTLIFNHGTGADAIRLNGSINFNATVGSTLTVIRRGGTWYELGRMTA